MDRIVYGGKSTPSILNDPDNNKNGNKGSSTLLTTLAERSLPSTVNQALTTRDALLHFAKCKLFQNLYAEKVI